MALKVNPEAVHTVQLEGKDVQVVPVTEVETLIQTATNELNTTVETVRKEERTNVNRDLSKKIGVNLFDDAATNAFLEAQKTKVTKEEYDKVVTQLDGFKELDTKYQELQLDTTLLKNSVSDKHAEQVKKLVKIEMTSAEGVTLEEATKKVLEEFPMFIDQQRKKAGIYLNGDSGTKTEYDKHVEEKYANNPYYKKPTQD